MAWYLQHHFNYQSIKERLKPTPGIKHHLHNLGYVQNVQAGQVLAEFVPLHAVTQPDPKYTFKSPIFPAGENTHIDPDNSHRLLASATGHVSYVQDKISVATVLKVHSDISFQTGNIIFYGDTAINGNIRAGFEVHGQNVLITGMVEGGIVRAQKSIHIQGGVRGGVSQHCLLVAKKDIRVGFMEKAEIQCQGNATVEKNCLHSTLYVARNAIIKDRLVGGTVHGRQGVMIAGQLGNKAATSTRIFLGYNPTHIRKLEKIESHLNALANDIRHLNAVAGHLGPQVNELSRKLHAARNKQARLIKSRNHLWNYLYYDEEHVTHCKVIALGEVFPGVEIAIGQAYLYVDKPYHKVVFSLEDGEIVCKPYTPPKK